MEERIEVMTREAEEVNDFTTYDKYFNIPTVKRPIITVLIDYSLLYSNTSRLLINHNH